MGQDKSDRLLVEVAKMYYEQGLTQQEIADQLHVNRINVVKMMQQAMEREIVQIRVIDPHSNFDELVQELKEYFDFLEIAIVPSYMSSLMRNKALGYRAARVLLSYIGANDTIGLGWGSSVCSMIREMPDSTELGLQPEWVPMIGSMCEGDVFFQVNEFAKTMQRKLGGVWRTLNVPALLDSPLLVEALKSDERIHRIVEEWQNLDIAIFGIGNPGVYKETRYPSTYGRFMTESEQDKLSKLSVQGDLMARFYDDKGRVCDPEYDARIFGIGMEDVKKVPIRFAIAAGERKSDAIYYALKNRIMNILVTDEIAAVQILEKAKQERSLGNL